MALVQYADRVMTDRNILKSFAEKVKPGYSTKPFVPVLPPIMMRPEVMDRMARLEPREERYHIPSDDMYLIGSAEHTLGPLHMDEIVPVEKLPIRYVGFSTSFRREAGASGKDTRGILRVHQFDKVEMESFTTPEDSETEQDFLVAVQEYLIQSLELPYRLIMCCTGDQGDTDARHIDLDTWMPGENKYRETHSADLTADYQSRRLQIAPASRGRHDRAGAHERRHCARRPHAHRHPGELPDRRRQRSRSEGTPAVHGQGDHFRRGHGLR